MKTAPDCAAIAPPVQLQVEQCGGAEPPPPTPEELVAYHDRRQAQIADQTWPCHCYCKAAEAQHQHDCMLRP